MNDNFFSRRTNSPTAASERSWGKVKEAVSLISLARKRMEEHVVRTELLIWLLFRETGDFLILVLAVPRV